MTWVAIGLSAGTMIVNRYNWIIVGLTQCPDGIVNPFLHFRICTLHRVQLNGIFKFSSCHRGNSASTHTNPVIIATK